MREEQGSMTRDLVALFGTAAAILLLTFGCALLASGGLARQTEARAELERARMEREHQRSEDWRREFETYSVTLAAFLSSPTILLFLLAAVAFVAFGGGFAFALWWWAQRWPIWIDKERQI